MGRREIRIGHGVTTSAAALPIVVGRIVMIGEGGTTTGEAVTMTSGVVIPTGEEATEGVSVDGRVRVHPTTMIVGGGRGLVHLVAISADEWRLDYSLHS